MCLYVCACVCALYVHTLCMHMVGDIRPPRTSKQYCFHHCGSYILCEDYSWYPQHPRCMMVLSFVLNMSKDPDPGVCSAAVRTLGMFVTYPSLSEVRGHICKFNYFSCMYKFVLRASVTNVVLMFYLFWNFF